jgi:hypothetical protein
MNIKHEVYFIDEKPIPAFIPPDLRPKLKAGWLQEEVMVSEYLDSERHLE